MFRSEHVIAAEHPALPGHFPGNTIVPGVVLLDHVVEALASFLPGTSVAGIANVKFQRPLLPGQRFLIELQPPANGKVRFSVRAAEAELAAGVLKLAAVQP
jgi:3-hydroxymyristoyl/3-hydroxydecanoyl-(acyl carrier protein) dehydratase